MHITPQVLRALASCGVALVALTAAGGHGSAPAQARHQGFSLEGN